MSRARLEEHRRLWSRKPVLACVYEVWFEALLAEVPKDAVVLEVGAGPGFLSEHARRRRKDLRWVATELTEAPWNDVACDALRLPIRSRSVDAVVGLDVIHHLIHPGQFLTEARRVLMPRGRLVVVEPWVTPLSYPIYRWVHQESCALNIDPWNPFSGREAAAKDAFDGNAAVLWRIVRDKSARNDPDGWRPLGFHRPRLRVLNGFAYLLSLGFRTASLLPPVLAGFFLGLDRLTEPLSGLLGLRALAVWEALDIVNP